MTDKICAAPDCNKSVEALGWCGKHYMRLRRHGDALRPSIKTPNGELARYLQDEVLTYDGDECLIWPYARSNGYGKITIGRKQHLVHRLVCQHVHGAAPAPDLDAAHSCGKGHEGCVAKRHISWKTRAENMADKAGHGTLLAGERHVNSKLTEDAVREIRSLRGVVTQTKIAERFGISRANVSIIQSGQTWAGVAL